MACRDCEYFDEKDREPFFKVKGYCSYYRSYYDQGDNCNNFRPSGYTPSTCYITTIVHEVLRKDDECDTMETLRNFRNNILNKNKKYESILEEYDVIGKRVANAIKIDNDKDLCEKIYNNFLLKVAYSIKKKNYLKAITDYEQMTMMLISYYNIPVNDDIKNYDYTKGGHGKVYTK